MISTYKDIMEKLEELIHLTDKMYRLGPRDSDIMHGCGTLTSLLIKYKVRFEKEHD